METQKIKEIVIDQNNELGKDFLLRFIFFW